MTTMGRERKRRNASLPPNLYEVGNGYYAYRHPQTGKRHGMGKSRREAVAAAKQLNGILAPSTSLAEKILERRNRFSDFLDWFESETLPNLGLAQETRRGHRQRLPHIRNALGELETAEITIADVAGFLDQFPATQSNRYRALLSVLFKHAIARGLCETNPANATLKRREEIKRERLSLDQFQAIRKCAAQWLQNAMDMALLTLQRREDLAALKWTQVKDGAIWIQQKKVEKHGSGNLKIYITPEISAVLERCQDGVKSDYVLHRQPARRVHAKSRSEFAQILPDMLSKEFSKCRSACGLFDDSIDARTLPSFHEIRSLGASLYEQQGRPPELIQALLGHVSASMTAHYLSGHGVKWAEIKL